MKIDTKVGKENGDEWMAGLNFVRSNPTRYVKNVTRGGSALPTADRVTTNEQSRSKFMETQSSRDFETYMYSHLFVF